GESKLLFHGNFKETKRDGDADKGVEFTVTVSPAAENGDFNPLSSLMPNAGHDASQQIDPLLPEPPPLVSVQQDVTINGYKFNFTQPVTHIQASSTRVDRVPLRMVPAYTLAVEPRQVISVLAKPSKAFDMLLRVHSYATQSAKT